MQGAQDQVACFGGGKTNFDGFPVAHLTDENDLWCLAECGTESGGEVVVVAPHFTLVEGRFLLGMDELNRVLERYDMYRFGFIELVQQCGQGGRLPAAGRSCNEYQACFFLRHRSKHGRQIQLRQRWYFSRQSPEDDRVVAALGEDVDAEAGLLTQRIRLVTGARFQEITG